MADYNGLTRNAWPGTWSPSSNHPIVLDTEMRGGLRYVSGDSGDRVSDITGQRLQDGMLKLNSIIALNYKLVNTEIVLQVNYLMLVLIGKSLDQRLTLLLQPILLIVHTFKHVKAIRQRLLQMHIG